MSLRNGARGGAKPIAPDANEGAQKVAEGEEDELRWNSLANLDLDALIWGHVYSG